MNDFIYACNDEADIECAATCVSVADCEQCGCRFVRAHAGGPWGEVMDVFFCLLPIIFLIYCTMKPKPLPTTRSLPLAALMLWFIRLAYFGSDPLLTCASVISGILEALTPLSIMAGAMTLFETMEATYCLPYIIREMKSLTKGHPVAELMLIYAFAQTVEGASGFGTPAALGAPMLVSSGHPALESVVVLLLMNTFVTVWGAVGTPIWYGFGSLGFSDEDLLQISQKAAVALAISATVLIPIVLTVIVPFRTVRQNIIFIYAAILASVGPSAALAIVNYEFPSLVGGLAGCFFTALLIRYNIGFAVHTPETKDELSPEAKFGSSEPDTKSINEEAASGTIKENMDTEGEDDDVATSCADSSLDLEQGDFFGENSDAANNTEIKDSDGTLGNIASKDAKIKELLGPRKTLAEGYLRESAMRSFPIWGVVLLLILTRIPEIGIRDLLTRTEPSFHLQVGSFGEFRISASLVVQLRDILDFPNVSWKYDILYVPFLLPFVFVSYLTMLIFRKQMEGSPQDIARTVGRRLSNPAIALFGALSLVQLMLRSGTASPVYILGNTLADWFQEGFVVISPLLGALGSFFSGSTTVSNLTFGSIQKIAAESIGVSSTTMLALQTVGASAGIGICLNTIIAACAVVGLSDVGEGQILKRTFKIVFSSTTIATVVMLAFYFRFD